MIYTVESFSKVKKCRCCNTTFFNAFSNYTIRENQLEVLYLHVGSFNSRIFEAIGKVKAHLYKVFLFHSSGKIAEEMERFIMAIRGAEILEATS